MQSLNELLPELDRRYAVLRETLQKSTEEDVPYWRIRLARGDVQSLLNALTGDDEKEPDEA